jgi:alanyl-tRNA synthetase
MTERLYYFDAYLTRFEAEIVEVQGAAPPARVYLNRTAFYPASGGQPFDLGRIAGARVLDVIDEGERVAHLVEAELPPGAAECEIDWPRRFDHMQQHTGQHLLSAAFVEVLGFETVSFHLGPDAATIDLAAGEIRSAQAEAVEARANALVFENRPVTVRFYSAEEAACIGLRKPSGRPGVIRVVEIDGCDRSACGGTHVRATGEVGPIFIRRLDRVRRNVRVEFVCGRRAVRCARADQNALAAIAQMLSSSPGQAPALVRAQIEAARAAEKLRQKLESDLAACKGRELYAAIPADAGGRRLYQIAQPSGPIEPWRLLAQHFTSAGPGAVFLLTIGQPPTLLLAVSADSAAHAGNIVKAAVELLGGRGGGSPRMGQGSLPDPSLIPSALDRVREKLRN